MSSLDGVINVKDAAFNAIGNGCADDHDAVVQALAVSMEQGKPLYFPPGNYRVCLTPLDHGGIALIGLHVKKDVTILGLSADDSRLTLEIDTCDAAPTDAFNGFVISNGAKATFRNLTIASPDTKVVPYTTDVVDPSDLTKTRLVAEGHGFADGTPVLFTGPSNVTPTKAGPEVDADGDPIVDFLKRNGDEIYFVVNAAPDHFQVSRAEGGDPLPLPAPKDEPATAFVLRQTHAVIAISKMAGDGDLTLDGVRITGSWRCAVNDNAGDHVTRFTSSDLHGTCSTCGIWGVQDGVRYAKTFLARDCDFRPAGDHHVYIHPSVSFDMQDCRHYRASWFAFHNYGEDPLTKNVAPAYARISRAYFESCGTAIRTGGAVDESGHAATYQIVDSVFRDVGTAIELRNPARISSCTFVDCTTGVGTAGSDGASAVTIDGCSFRTKQKAIETGPAAATAAWNVAQCTFEKLGAGPVFDHTRPTAKDGPPAETQPDYPLRFTQCSFIAQDPVAEIGRISKMTSLDSCDFHGTWSTGMDVAQYKVTTRVAMRNCRSLIPAGQAALISTNNAPDLLGFELVGGENEIAGYLAILPPYHGDLVLGHRTGADIVSAETVVVQWNADTYRVSDDETIEEIWVNGHDSTTRATCGVLNLIALDGWRLADTKNISPSHTAPRYVGELVRLRHDAFTDKWVEIGDDE